MDIAPEATVEVAGPHGHPRRVALDVADDGVTVRVRAADASGPDPAPPGGVVTWGAATSYGIGQLLDAARRRGADRIVLDLDGVAAADGGAGALSGLGFRVVVADGSGLKVGGDDLGCATGISGGWSADWSEVAVELVTTDGVAYDEAVGTARRCGLEVPDPARAAEALTTWATVVERDLAGADVARPGAGAGGGTALALLAALPRATLAVAGPGRATR